MKHSQLKSFIASKYPTLSNLALLKVASPALNERKQNENPKFDMSFKVLFRMHSHNAVRLFNFVILQSDKTDKETNEILLAKYPGL